MATTPVDVSPLLPIDAVQLRRIVARRYVRGAPSRQDVVQLLILPDDTLLTMAAVVNSAMGAKLKVVQLSSLRPGLVRYELWLRFADAIGLRYRYRRHGQWTKRRLRARMVDDDVEPATAIEPSLEELQRRWRSDGVPIAMQERWVNDYVNGQLGTS